MAGTKVGILMGSDSDLPIMKDAAKVLKDFGIEFEVKVLSAHRTPDAALDYAKNAHKNNIGVLIAGAGGSAHLPGVLAAVTHLPVIGVPVLSKTLLGLDSLYSIVQMPSGIPVATVAINGATNAGLLAVQILSTADETLVKKFQDYKKSLAEKVVQKNAALVLDI